MFNQLSLSSLHRGTFLELLLLCAESLLKIVHVFCFITSCTNVIVTIAIANIPVSVVKVAVLFPSVYLPSEHSAPPQFLFVASYIFLGKSLLCTV